MMKNKTCVGLQANLFVYYKVIFTDLTSLTLISSLLMDCLQQLRETQMLTSSCLACINDKHRVKISHFGFLVFRSKRAICLQAGNIVNRAILTNTCHSRRCACGGGDQEQMVKVTASAEQCPERLSWNISF